MSEDLKSIFEVPPKPPPKRPSFWKNQAKYFLHGFLWFLFAAAALLIFPFLLFFLVEIGLIIGAIIGLAILFLFIGFVNSLISDHLWFPIKDITIWDELGHGLLLAITLIIVHGLTVFLPTWASGNNVYVILLTLIWGCYIDGRIGKAVAGLWKRTKEDLDFDED